MRVFLSKIFSSKEAKPKHILMFLVPLFLVTTVCLILPHYTYAQAADILGAVNPANWLKWIGERIAEFFYALGFEMISLGYHLVVAAANASLRLVDNQAINEQWANSKKVTLDLFGAAVLAIAFMNMMKIKVEEWGFQRLIPKLLLTAFFVYFSKFICHSVVNLGTALTQTLAKDNFEKFDLLMNDIGREMAKGNVPSLPVSIGIFLIALLCFLLLLLLAAILFVRGFMLGMLIVISPVAFALVALPVTQGFFKKFWDMFIKWTFFLPICFFVLSIGLGFTTTITDIKPFQLAIQDPEGKGTEVIDKFDSFLFAAVTIPMAVFLPLGFLGAVGSHFQGVMTGKKGIPGAPVDMKSMRGWADERGKKIAARKQERFGGMMRKSFGRLPVAGGFITGESAQDRLNLNKDLTDKLANVGMSKGERRKYATGVLDRSSLGAETQKRLSDWESRGGSRKNAIDHLVKEGELDHTTATNKSVKAHIEKTGNYDDALKKSGLHQLRTGKFSEIGNSVGDMITPNIKGDGKSNAGLLKHQLIGRDSIKESMLQSLKADPTKRQQVIDLREHMEDMATHATTTAAEAADLRAKAGILR